MIRSSANASVQLLSVPEGILICSYGYIPVSVFILFAFIRLLFCVVLFGSLFAMFSFQKTVKIYSSRNFLYVIYAFGYCNSSSHSYLTALISLSF